MIKDREQPKKSPALRESCVCKPGFHVILSPGGFCIWCDVISIIAAVSTSTVFLRARVFLETF